MGIYDRDYNRSGPGGYQDSYGSAPGFHLGAPTMLSTQLVLVMAAVYVVQLLTREPPQGVGPFTAFFELHADVWRRPWMLFQLVTYGFLHSPYSLGHILLNCFGLWMFGRSIEEHYGRREFLVWLIAAIAFSGVVWMLAVTAFKSGIGSAALYGASGGVTAIIVLFALNFPHQRLLYGFLIPMPAWVVGVITVVLDLYGTVSRSEGDNVAYTAHLGGALFALLYFKLGWRLSSLLPGEGRTWSWPRLRRRPKFRVHMPDDDDDDGDAMDDEVDEILRKIRQHGQDSLTARERKILERASREYQRRKH